MTSSFSFASMINWLVVTSVAAMQIVEYKGRRLLARRRRHPHRPALASTKVFLRFSICKCATAAAAKQFDHTTPPIMPTQTGSVPVTLGVCL